MYVCSGKNRRHPGCGNVMRTRGCAVQNKGITLKVKQVISKYLENQKEKVIFQIAYCLKNMHRTYVVQCDIETNQEQIRVFLRQPNFEQPTEHKEMT